MAEFTDPASLMYVAVRLWTSAELLRGVEFCAMLNGAVRADVAETIEHVAVVTNAINAFCVTRRSGGTPVIRQQLGSNHVAIA